MKKVLWLLLVFIAACTVQKKVDKLDFKYLKFESVGCELDCEKFSILIKPNRPTLLNISNIKSKGTYSRTLSASEYNGLIDILKKMNVSTMKDSYGLGAEDTKTKFLTLGLGNNVKKIKYQAVAPPELRAMEKYIIDIKENKSWKKL